MSSKQKPNRSSDGSANAHLKTFLTSVIYAASQPLGVGDEVVSDTEKVWITFRVSRIKMAVQATILLPVLLISAGPNIAFCVVAFDGGNAGSVWMLGIFFPLFLACLALEFYVVRRLMNPDTLTISKSGCAMTRLGKTSSYQWVDYGRAARRFLTSGNAVIWLDAKSGGKPMLIPGEDYSQPMPVVFDAVRKAQEGVGQSRL